VHIARLAHPDVQLPARQDAHRELLDDAGFPFLRSWFLEAGGCTTFITAAWIARLHDSNFGIGFYFFDRFFRTMAKRHRPFNWAGLQSSHRALWIGETELVVLAALSQALFHKEPERQPRACLELPVIDRAVIPFW